MKHHYEDIRSRISERPKWFDENGVPRYCDFAPGEQADIYAREVVLLEIACQNCDQRFKVAVSRDAVQARLATHVARRSLRYGDPPNACDGPCGAGASMNSVPLRVVEFWEMESRTMEWKRRPDLEISLADEEQER